MASLVYDQSGTTAILSFSFDRVLVDRLKTIPPASRTYDPGTKSWRIQFPYDGLAAGMLREHFPDAEVQTPPQRDRWGNVAQGCQCDDDHRRLHVCQSAPVIVVQAAYKALAKQLHPDTGGDGQAMQALNASYERLMGGGR